MASRLLGPHSGPLHDDVAAYAFHYLDSKDRRSLGLVSGRSRKFINEKYPTYNQSAPKYKELTALQKIELEFIKFQDRPIWQRVGIVALCILFSPLILAYHSPKLLQKFCISVIAPCVRAMARGLEAIATKIYDYALAPIGRLARNVLRKIAVLTYNHVLTPAANVIYEIAKFIFITFPTHLYRLILHPLGRGVSRVLTSTNEYILTPLVRAIRSVFTGGLIRLLRALYTYVLVPVGHVLLEGFQLLYNHAFVPLAKAISVVARGLFITFPTKVWNHVLSPMLSWTLNWIVVPLVTKGWQVLTFLFHYVAVPIAKVLRVILKGICITFPIKIYAHVLSPIAQTIGRFFNFTYDVILKPMGRIIQSIASAIFNQLIVPTVNGIKLGARVLYTNVLSPLGGLIVSLPSIVGHVFARLG